MRRDTAQSRWGQGRVRDFVELLRDAMQSTGNTLRLCLLLLVCGAVMFGVIHLAPFIRFA